MTKYRFVPDHIAALVDGVCKGNEWTCLDLRKEGTYSGYFATVTDGVNTVEHFMGYDYGLLLPENERPAHLAGQLAALFGDVSVQAIVDNNKIEAIASAFGVDPALFAQTDEAETPKSPRKRGKSA